MVIRARVWISGKVQGVGYRYHTLQEAKRLGLAGWVRNLPDGRVEAIFEGDEALVKDMLRWCRQGSPGSRVWDVTVKKGQIEHLQGFKIR